MDLEPQALAPATAVDFVEYYPINYIHETEPVHLYNEGGHHPVHIGDTLNSRFEVVHKLGNGGLGNVWLCRDTLKEKWRAVKITVADQLKKGTEMEVSRYLRSKFSQEELERNHILPPLEEFSIVGPNGCHSCLVMPVYGPTVSEWRMFQEDHKKQADHDIRTVCRQIIESVQFLHGQRICHGDLRPGNILMQIQGIDDMSRDELLQLMGEPKHVRIRTLSGRPPAPRAPEYCVLPTDYSWAHKLTTASIAITDFGESFFLKTLPGLFGIPYGYAAPEVLMPRIGPVGRHSDIWSLACTLFEVRNGSPLFAGDYDGELGRVLGDIQFYLGPLPKAQLGIQISTEFENLLKEKEDRSAEAKGRLLEESGYSDIFEAALGKEQTMYLDWDRSDEVFKFRYPKDDVLGLADLLRGMLKYIPGDRVDIDGVLSHYWVKGIGKEGMPEEESRKGNARTRH
ncbi:kinase-like protein [Daldinia sp. FL1419]|nr:kinase-like protein [Daldinia sp. FL1419]